MYEQPFFYFYTLLTDHGIVYYEAETTDQAQQMAEEDGYHGVTVIRVDTYTDNVSDFVWREKQKG